MWYCEYCMHEHGLMDAWVASPCLSSDNFIIGTNGTLLNMKSLACILDIPGSFLAEGSGYSDQGSFLLFSVLIHSDTRKVHKVCGLYSPGFRTLKLSSHYLYCVCVKAKVWKSAHISSILTCFVTSLTSYKQLLLSYLDPASCNLFSPQLHLQTHMRSKFSVS